MEYLPKAQQPMQVCGALAKCLGGMKGEKEKVLSKRSVGAMHPSKPNLLPASQPWSRDNPKGNFMGLIAACNHLDPVSFHDRLVKAKTTYNMVNSYPEGGGGTGVLRKAVGHYLTRLLSSSRHPITEEHVRLCSGATTMLEIMAFH
eukprot:4677235-Prymnesium_polylepis.1